MNDRGLVDALRARDANALAELYDKYAESVYGYCWTLTGGPDGAQVALRDTMIAAEARIHALTDPARFRVWLYALARGECLRRRSAATLGADTEPGYTGLGAVARDAVDRLAPADREILELVHRHCFTLPDAARVLGASRRHARARYAAAAERLFDAVTAELRGRESQVFGLLPRTVLPESLRVRVMSCFVDPDLLPYRRLVARRVGPLDGAGFPVASERRVARGVVAGTASVAVTLAVALVFSQVWGAGDTGDTAASGTYPPSGEPADVRTLAEAHRDTSRPATRPFGRLPVVGVGLPTPPRAVDTPSYGEPAPTALPRTAAPTPPGASRYGLPQDTTGGSSPGEGDHDPGGGDAPGGTSDDGHDREHPSREHPERDRVHRDHPRGHATRGPRPGDARGDRPGGGTPDDGILEDAHGADDAGRHRGPGRRPSPGGPGHDGASGRLDRPVWPTGRPPVPSPWSPRSSGGPWPPARRTPQGPPPHGVHRTPDSPRPRTVPAPAPAPTPRPCAPGEGSPPSGC